MVTILDVLCVPSVCLETCHNIFSEGTFSVTINRDMVVIIYHDQIAKLQMSRHRSCLTSNTLHGTTITKEAICVVVDKIEAWLIEHGCGVGLRDRKTNRIAETLTQGARRNFNARSVMSFWVAWCDAVNMLHRD